MYVLHGPIGHGMGLQQKRQTGDTSLSGDSAQSSVAKRSPQCRQRVSGLPIFFSRRLSRGRTSLMAAFHPVFQRFEPG
jgi:hypothetical protein